jgi:hypothetical protein
MGSGSGLELQAGAAHTVRMPDKSKFYPKTKGGRWTVRIFTGRGPNSHVGDFATEEEAKHWISTKSKDWEAAYDPRLNPNGPKAP